MTTTRALILDDDSWYARGFKARLQSRFPSVVMEIRTEPDISGDFDIYFIDNDFGGASLAGDLVRQIRCINPGGLVVALSSTLDTHTLKDLLNHQCDFASDKTSAEDLERLFQVVQAFLARRSRVAARSGTAEMITSIADLLREWNARLQVQSK